MPGHVRWSVNKKDLIGLTPIKARDLIIDCFFEIQRDSYVRSLGLSDEKQWKIMAVSTVRRTMSELHENFDTPSKQSLVRLVEGLAEKSSTWGAPPDEIVHHMMQLSELLNALK